MKPGKNGELILEGRTEARVAAELLPDALYGKLMPHFEPPINEGIGRLEFMFRRVADRVRPDETEYVVNDPRVADLAAQAISVSAMPGCLTPPVPDVMSRRAFMAERVREYYQLVQAQES